ncbi:unnamed protein product [Lathyrus sativus]|nr:unnamed protein product [Lathyrus sativus]
MYPFERFMGDSKQSVKNKGKVEGSIYAHFNHLMLTPRIIRNPVNVNKKSQFTFSIFKLPGRPSGKKDVHWLTQKQMQFAHIYVLTNYVEVKPCLEEFNISYFHSTGVQATSSHIHAHFQAWFKEKLSCIIEPTQEILHFRNLSEGPI